MSNGHFDRADVQVSDPTRKDVWELMLNLERNVRYYQTIGDNHSVASRFMRFVVLAGILSEGVIVSIAGTVTANDYLWVVGGMVAVGLAILTVFDVVTGFGDSAAVLRHTAMTCDDLKSEAEELWRQIETHRVSDLEAEIRYRPIIDQWSRATQKISLSLRSEVNETTTREACEVLQNKYGR